MITVPPTKANYNDSGHFEVVLAESSTKLAYTSIICKDSFNTYIICKDSFNTYMQGQLQQIHNMQGQL